MAMLLGVVGSLALIALGIGMGSEGHPMAGVVGLSGVIWLFAITAWGHQRTRG